MAIGAVTITTQGFTGTHQATYLDIISVPGDTSYPTGGQTGLQAALRAALGGQQREILAVFDVDANGGNLSRWDLANGKWMVFRTGASSGAVLSELANATNLSGVSFKLAVLSR